MAIVTVSGNVGSCDFKISPNGKPFLVVSIADRRWNYKDETEETAWHRAIWFGERAEKLVKSLEKAKVLSVTGKEAYKVYEGKIDRSLEPLDHTILQFKKEEETTAQNTHNNNSNSNPYQNNYDYPPPNDDDIPFL